MIAPSREGDNLKIKQRANKQTSRSTQQAIARPVDDQYFNLSLHSSQVEISGKREIREIGTVKKQFAFQVSVSPSPVTEESEEWGLRDSG